MRIKRKTEEKKMSMNKNIARLAVTAGLTAALSFGGVMAPVTMAFAEGVPTVATEKGKVFITDPGTAEYADTSFKGIQIFKATVTQNKDEGVWTGDKTLSDIAWANDPVMRAVTTAFDTDEPKPAGFPTDADAKSPQAWAQFIKKHGNDKDGNNVNAGSVLDKIAAALEDSNLTWAKPSGSNKGNFESLDQGYWLFVTDVPSKTGNTDVYTSPIFTIVGGSDVNVAPKKSVPNVTKAVKDDATDATFNKSADSRMDQPIKYQLAGTVASNINTYSTYAYLFTDNLPGSMTVKCDEDGSPIVDVKIDGKTVKADPASGYTKSYSGGVLTVSFVDLKSCVDEKNNAISVNGSSNVTVEYEAKLDSTKIFDDKGKIKDAFQGLVGKPQKNTVTLTYSNNPHGNGIGTTVEHSAYDYTYGIDVTKVGSDDENKGLAGVEFTLQEQGDDGNYIKADGTKTPDSEQAKLTTDASGKINVVGLDEGTYVLTEVKPAPGYNNSHSAGITFTITRGALPADDTTVVNPGCTLANGTDENLVKVAQTNTEAADGKVHLTVTDQQGSGLPLTGLNGVTFTWIAGGAVLCIGVAHLIRSRKQAEESEQE